MKRNLIAMMAGVVFALGLGISGMTLPAKVMGFLDFAGAWDPALAFVMAGAVVTYALLFRLMMKRRKQPVYEAQFGVPTRRDLTPSLILGSVMFGVGWGLSGYCPGPALMSAVTLGPDVWVFLIWMTAGMGVFRAYASWQARERSNAPANSMQTHSASGEV